MKLTTSNAHEYVGKKLTGGPFHYWPLEVKEIRGLYYVVDRNGCMMLVKDDDPVYFRCVDATEGNNENSR